MKPGKSTGHAAFAVANMISGQWICFMLYAGFLAWEDLRTGYISLHMILSGSLVGMGFLGMEIWAGASWETCLLTHGTALFWGILLLLASRLTRGAVGKGDGLCFLSFG